MKADNGIAGEASRVGRSVMSTGTNLIPDEAAMAVLLLKNGKRKKMSTGRAGSRIVHRHSV